MLLGVTGVTIDGRVSFWTGYVELSTITVLLSTTVVVLVSLTTGYGVGYGAGY